ncbi:MAG: spore coat protein [Acholeplasmataceae bacterium]|nr:spore coat protein [Acholeplasmataceae bacterium]
MGVISKLVKISTDISDQTIYAYALNAAKAGAKAYLTGTLVSTTPELRTFFSTQLQQLLQKHSALVALGIKNGWLNPELSPDEALEKELDKATSLFDDHE